ncbi:hypothetical protein D0869_15321 [Hortaea werneckii]|uniref:non-specific serine/threonine protein kinase n=1 Tax=Hortaea werneckii TaxID=91943 RepID=A0A3M6VZP2_HORWE|nr:hypothetical protein D0869_15321 [Hortaea werneckii]
MPLSAIKHRAPVDSSDTNPLQRKRTRSRFFDRSNPPPVVSSTSSQPVTLLPRRLSASRFFNRSTSAAQAPPLVPARAIPSSESGTESQIAAAQAQRPPPASSPVPRASLSKLRRSASRFIHRLRTHQTDMSDAMDGASLPNHRTATPTAPAIYKKLGKIRSRFSSSSGSNGQQLQIPQRRRSVHFDDQLKAQFDGTSSETGEHVLPMRASDESRTSRVSSKLSERIAALESKLNEDGGKSTVVHRANVRHRPSTPHIKTNMDAVLGRKVEAGNASPSTPSSTTSFTPSAHNANWSPASTASTAATSFNSPGSSGSRYKQISPEDAPNNSKSLSGGQDDNVLPPIEEDSGRYLMIPVQESPVEVNPSVTTVENVAAAKVYLETHFNDLLSDSMSPRELRRKRFEQLMCDKGLSHDERVAARQEWLQTESNHLRQARILKATSLNRHKVKGISIAGFDVIRVLRKGSFGVVRLVTERGSNAHSNRAKDGGGPFRKTSSASTTCVSNMDGTARRALPAGKPLSDVFAMKVIRKSEMLRACQEGHLRAERDFLVGAEGSRWVVPLIASFQDNTNLYLVMEYMIGGDFLGLLLREDVLEEDVAK